MASTTISTRLDSEEVTLLESLGELTGTDRSSLVRSLLRRGMKGLRLEQATAAYRSNAVTLSRASEIAGLSQWDFVAQMENKSLDLHYGVDELETDLRTFKSLS